MVPPNHIDVSILVIRLDSVNVLLQRFVIVNYCTQIHVAIVFQSIFTFRLLIPSTLRYNLLVFSQTFAMRDCTLSLQLPLIFQRSTPLMSLKFIGIKRTYRL